MDKVPRQKWRIYLFIIIGSQTYCFSTLNERHVDYTINKYTDSLAKDSR